MVKGSLARVLLGLGCLVGAVGWLLVFDLRSPFERVSRQQSDAVVNVSLANPHSYLPRRLTAESIASVREEMSRFARGVAQPELDDAGPDELRILLSWADFGATPTGVSLTGYIVRDRRIAKCSVAYGKTLDDPMTGHCSKAKALRPGSTVYDWSVLEGLGGAEYSCGTADGWWGTVEGRRNGRRFVFAASNPDYCQDIGSKVFAGLLGGI